jgi:hypothetical protein
LEEEDDPPRVDEEPWIRRRRAMAKRTMQTLTMKPKAA